MRTCRLSHAFLYSIVVAACRDASPAGGSLSAISDSAGVAIVTGPAADVPLPWTVTEVRRIGGEDAGPASFTSANWWSVATDGRSQVAVLDSDNNQIQVFDSAGVHVRTLGRRGGGPGELQFPSSLAMGGDGTVSVFDFAKRAVVRWAGDGTVLPETRWDEARGFPTGRSIARGDTIAFQVRGGDTTHVVKSIRLMTPRDTVDVDSLVGPREQMIMFSCVGLTLSPLFSGDLEWALGDGMLATTSQAHYVIDIRRGGGIVRSIRRSVVPAAATAADAARLYPTGMEVSFGSGRKCVTPASEVAEKAGVAPTIPVVRTMRFGPDGSLWVERYRFKDQAPAVDVFDPEGRYLGTLEGKSLPMGFIGTDLVLFQVNDDDTGGSFVGIYRINRGT